MGRIHRSGKVFGPLISSHQDQDDVSSANILPPTGTGSSSSNIVTEIPECLYLAIQCALDTRKHIETKTTNYAWYKRDLKVTEKRIDDLVKFFILSKDLPSDWKYDPATANTLVKRPVLNFDTPIEKRPKKSRGCCHSRPRLDENGEPRKIYREPLNQEEEQSWLDFKDIDRDVQTLRGVCFNKNELTSVSLHHPFVRVIASFAVKSYNKAIESKVKDKDSKLSDDWEVIKCNYRKLPHVYWFYMTLKATAQGKRGVYETNVHCTRDDGTRTLSMFEFVITKAGKRASEKSVLKNEEKSVIKNDYFYSGLVCRPWGTGYDYFYQNGIDRHWGI